MHPQLNNLSQQNAKDNVAYLSRLGYIRTSHQVERPVLQQRREESVNGDEKPTAQGNPNV